MQSAGEGHSPAVLSLDAKEKIAVAAEAVTVTVDNPHAG